LANHPDPANRHGAMKGKTVKKDLKSEDRDCPLYERTISLGKCLDVNFERLRYLRDDAFKTLARISGKTIEELHHICKTCPNQPFPDDNIGTVESHRHPRDNP
jgi:hypothetical protein